MNPMNVRVPVGTSIGEIINFCGGFKEENLKK
jgi:Na+-translocating ferredoxin:NAD+ oxidoreductase RnfC subunit